MKPKKLFTLCMGLALLYSAQAQQFDLSTGMVNGGAAPVTSADDTWTVSFNNGPQNPAFVCNNNPAWVMGNCSQWITPVLNGANPGVNAGNGMFRFRATFELDCPPQAAVLNIINMAGDNDIQNFILNGQAYVLDPAGDNDFGAFIANQAIPLNAADLVMGLNVVEVLVNNTSSLMGFNFCGNITVTPQPLVPSITGPTSLCAGALLTFTGNDGPGVADFHTWEIVESNSSGVPVSGATVHSYSSAGAPGTFTFPISMLCGKYYRVRLSVSGPCQPITRTDHVIFIACPPTANAGSDAVICEGSCVTIGTPGTNKVYYNWTYMNNGVQTYAGNTAQITVCPDQTTTYTLTVSTPSGCFVTDAVTVTVLENDPMFSFDDYVYQSGYYTVTAYPNVAPNGNYTWIVQELDGAGNPLFTITGGVGLWNSINNSFPGFNHPATAYSGNYTSLPATPVQGRFLYNRTYRITRGVWTNSCPWRQASLILSTALRGSNEEIRWKEDTDAPDLSMYKGASLGLESAPSDMLRVYPNPSNGVFRVSLPGAVSGTLRVFDATGKVVSEAMLPENTTDYRVDLSSHAKGLYLVTFTANGVRTTQKLLLE